MSKRKVKTTRDHILRISQTSATQAIEELIWNGLDSGGKKVEVRFSLNQLDSIESIEVIDHGCGIIYHELSRAFGDIGNSKKLIENETPEGRAVHGREGKGRFKALSICSEAKWTTTYKEDKNKFTYDIIIRRDLPEFYEATDPQKVEGKNTGTRVRLEGVDKGQNSLHRDDTRGRLTQRFAFYLTSYPETQIIYGGHSLSPKHLIDQRTDIELPTEKHGRPKASLTIIEWRFRIPKKELHLCNMVGFSHYDMPAGVSAPGIEYSAYLCSPEVDDWYTSNQLSVVELDENIREVINLAKDKLREYLRERLAEEAADVVEEWKKQDVYPYAEHEKLNPLKTAERQVFDIVAVRVNEQHPTFKDSDTDNKKLTLALIKESLESNPSSLSVILNDVIKLPQAEQDDFAELLKRTPLSSLIKAGRLVTERLDILQAFEHILFDTDWKKKLLERTQLHRLLVHELWILGEEYSLVSDDEGLKEVLRKHLHILGREKLAAEIDVKLIDGKEGIPDLMLSSRRKVDRALFEHLVIELKRPSINLGQDEIGQIEKYAFSVTADDRFNTNKVRWKFILLGNEFDKYAQRRASGDALPEGCIHREGNVSIWVCRWADVIADARDRHEFFRDKLEIEASGSEGIDYLTKKFKHLMKGRGASKKKDREIMAQKE